MGTILVDFSCQLDSLNSSEGVSVEGLPKPDWPLALSMRDYLDK